MLGFIFDVIRFTITMLILVPLVLILFPLGMA